MRKHLILAIGLAAVALSPGAGRADDPVDCKHAETQLDLNVCSQHDLDQADATLNADYQKIVARLQGADAKYLEHFKAAQRAWLKFRDAECEFQGSFTDGGSIQPLMINGCLKGLTEKRVKELQYYVDCEEGDLTCPVPGIQ